MKRRSFQAVVAGTFGALLIGATSAAADGRALTTCTPALVPPADGYLYCTVRATSRTPIAIVAHVMSGAGVDVTQFGTGFRASPEATGAGYYAEETAGSLADDARYCTATITGVPLKRNVEITLTAFDAQGVAVATVDGGSSPRNRPCS